MQFQRRNAASCEMWGEGRYLIALECVTLANTRIAIHQEHNAMRENCH
jgi:hypothetical protein